MPFYASRVLFQLYCAAFHIATCFVATGPPRAIINAAWVVSSASVVLILFSFRTDRAAFRFALLTTLVCFAAILLLRIGPQPTMFYLPPVLILMQLIACFVSLRSLSGLLQKIRPGQIERGFGVPQMFVATTAFAASLALLRFLPIMDSLSLAWISYSVFAINIVLVATRSSSIAMTETMD